MLSAHLLEDRQSSKKTKILFVASKKSNINIRQEEPEPPLIKSRQPLTTVKTGRFDQVHTKANR